jgi:nucleoside-diphosphate-sugar epimerase
LGVRLQVVDLLDDKVAYRLLEGCEAVVHLANLTGQLARPLAHQVLNENVAMNGNVFRPALELGVRRFVFASSIQVILSSDDRLGSSTPPPPYLPLDGAVPRRPLTNPYALSKELGERLLEVTAEYKNDIACTALRFPFLIGERTGRWIRRRRWRREHTAFDELLYLTVPDAACLIQAAVERQKPGYHCYFPAQTYQVSGWSTRKMADEFCPNTPHRLAADSLDGFADLREIHDALGWKPANPPYVIELE